jgi:hypothetical protein
MNHPDAQPPTPRPADKPLPPDCARTLDWLQGQLDRDDPAEPAPGGHAAGCPECQDWVAASQRLHDGLRLAPRPRPPAGFADRLVRAVAAERRDRQRRRVAVGLGAALAASVLVGLILPFVYRPTPDTPGPVAVTPSPAETPSVAAVPPAPTVTLRDSLAEAGAAVASFTRRKADETVGSTFSLLPVPESDLLAGAGAFAPSFDPVAESLDEARSGAAAGLEPVAGPARRAFDRLFAELGPMGSARPESY